MVVDLRPMLRGETNIINIAFEITPGELPGVEFEGDARVRGYVTDKGGYMRLVLAASVDYITECARCLDKVKGCLDIDFERTIKAEAGSETDNADDDVDEYAILENGMLNIDEELGEALLLEFPMRVLCSEDCPGLCPKCGKQLKHGDCGCPKHDIDPRWAVLQGIKFDSDEED